MNLVTQPTDYSGAFSPQSPTQALAQGYQLGAGIRDDQQQQLALQQQQTALQAQQKALQGLAMNPNSGAQDYASASLLFPQLKDQLKQSWDMKNTAQQEQHLSTMGQAYAAVTNGRPDVAVQQLQNRADAMQNGGGSPQEIQAIRSQAQLIALHPELARASMGLTLAALPGGDKVLTGVHTAGTEQRAQQEAPADLLKKQADASKAATDAQYAAPKAEADIGNINSQIGERTAQVKNLSDRLALDQDKLTSEVQMKVQEFKQKAGELPEPVMKNINEATTNAIAAKQSAEKMTGLADQIDGAASEISSGRYADYKEWLKNKTGTQNEISRIRGEYNRIVTPAAMAAYKQVASGSTSDKDIETAMIGVPKDTADAATMASFLRGTAKLQRYNEVLENAKSEWYAGNKFLGKSTSDMEIDGVKVPKGSSFKDFTEQYVTKKAGQMQGQSVLDSLAKKYSSGATGSY